MKRLAIFLSTFITLHCANADLLTDCMTKISNDPNFSNTMTSEIFPNASELSQEYATQRKNKIMGLIASEFIIHCMENIDTHVKCANGKVWYTRDGKTYAFQFKMPELFQYTDIPVGIMIYNKTNLNIGEVITLSDIPKLYWPTECSDHVIWDNLNNKAAVNVAGQKVFSQYGGSDNEFFLDFEEGNNRRAFPGLVLMDKTSSSSEAIVSFTNFYTAVNSAEQFATALNGTSCSNDNLAVYVVGLDVKPLSTKDKTGWGIVASVVGGSAAVVGVSSALAAAGATSGLLTAAAVSGTVPVVGWIVAGVLGATATVISLVPTEIRDIQQVMVLDGPYIIK
ncbi:MAG: hypothetical protein E7011_01580 [Alphaproteobacteria bacterium]|nr:hypothetical protein [Alphaproteobacteria bacterium]